MNWAGKTWALLRKRASAVSAGAGALAFVVAILSLIVAALQAGLLFTQRATPYRAAIYVRQLEVAGDFAGVANAQLMRLNQIVRACQSGLLNGEQFVAQIKGYREGLDQLNNAYAETLVGFPTDDHAVATRIRDGNESIFNVAMASSPNCTTFRTQYDANDGDGEVRDISADVGTMLTALRTRLAVDSLSEAAPVAEMRKRIRTRRFIYPYAPVAEKPAAPDAPG